MTKLGFLNSVSIGSLATLLLTGAAAAETFSIPPSDLKTALDKYTNATGVDLIYPDDEMRSTRTAGVQGDLSPDGALSRILKGTGFAMRHEAGGIAIIHEDAVQSLRPISRIVVAASAEAASSSSIESVVVTSSKIKGDIQTVPIAITALSQEQLTSRQIAGGPDLVKEVPNLTFSKTNFTGYNIQIRGIGTQAISVTTDPAVAVAFNDIPFIRNHFFEQEFYDVGQVEVLRGPQGTLYGRNATAGVVNVISAKPTDQFEAMASADVGNYHNRRFEGMINIPIVDDRLDVRFAGEWTKRDGYTFDTTLNTPVDGRDLWSGRATLSWKPSTNFEADLVWEHFGENDDRMRTAKQLCETSQPVTVINGVPVPGVGSNPPNAAVNAGGALTLDQNYTSQGCVPTSLYSPSAFQVPFGPSLPFVIALSLSPSDGSPSNPYAETTQSADLRSIQSALVPKYKAKNDTLEFNTNYNLDPSLTLTSQTGYNRDLLSSSEDYNRFDTTPGVFSAPSGAYHFPTPVFFPDPAVPGASIFCDPQLGCSDRVVAQDMSEEGAWQLSQEFRLTSNFSGPFNFSAGGNYLHYETEENYYVFINALTVYALGEDQFGDQSTLDHSDCIQRDNFRGGWQNLSPAVGGGEPFQSCVYIDTNPIGKLNNKGHNYFLSQNPYTLNSYAGFGEAYYDIAGNLKLTAGLRYTIDKKHFSDIPSEVVDQGYGYPVTAVVNQQWDRLTGRAVLNWTPHLDFTDQTLVYGSYAHGYKAGGANPPGAEFPKFGDGAVAEPIHPLTFRPEYIGAFELGTKNSLLDGSMTLNGDIFYYDYKDYQISEIVDRTSINLNFNAKVKGAEIETTWEPAPGLKFSFAGGYESTRINDGQSAIDLMDRTAGMPGWMVIKPFPTQASNCILPDYVLAALLKEQPTSIYNDPADAFPNKQGGIGPFACEVAYNSHLDPVTNRPYTPDPTGISTASQTIGDPAPIPAGYPGFDPSQPAINNGEGFTKNVGGNQLPNAPHFTTSLTGEYTMPVSEDWAATLHGDFYWQSQSFARVFNDRPYDKIRGYSSTNLALILTSANGWQVLGYLKNVFDTTAITGDFLNSDDSGLTTNVFLTDPRLYGVRVTKNF
ncbi:MAG TPA: TonB-dependent receptor [Rhizomicrobium sp.]|nr:TonB-dependent receptor [Rhizomicrobium sp.]